ncbi:hypothetical protein Y032_0030g2049 [Ancylostoma ceylanicum]|uniref:Uncharacterized protein n=1 Tax=Ancylostoma ceylanicum TaxID=53326 RepID=A0A016UPV3_9BILA|nr:hypothetical protein Y032_0030g2049 [Ancylostoma ceylanicum]
MTGGHSMRQNTSRSSLKSSARVRCQNRVFAFAVQKWSARIFEDSVGDYGLFPETNIAILAPIEHKGALVLNRGA